MHQKKNGSTRDSLTNEQMARCLEAVAELLEGQHANPYRVQAYRTAVVTLRNIDEPAGIILEREGMEGLILLPGIGESIAQSIEQMVRTGRLIMLDRLRGETEPEDVLATVLGIGPELAHRVHEQIGVESLLDLEAAAYDGRLAGVPGFGQKRLRGVRESLGATLKTDRVDPKKMISPVVVVQLLVFIVIVPFLPLLISRHWDWWEAWVFAAIYILGFAASRALVARHHPDLLAERARFMQHEDAKPWDKYLAPLVGLGGGLIPLVAGLDALFDGSFVFSVPVKMLALVLILAGFALGSYALIENRFFSGMVRIQTERGHHVVSSGPYRWVRHPGYAGALLSYLATPFFLDSRWALLPAVFITVLLVIRTRLEDKTLQDELAGYQDYVRRVRYRLFPGVW